MNSSTNHLNMDDFSTKFFTKLNECTGFDHKKLNPIPNSNSKILQKTILQQFDKIDHSKCLILPNATKWLLYLGRITGQIYTLETLENAEHCQQNIENRFQVHTNRALPTYTRKARYVDDNSIHCSNPYHYSKAWRPDMNKVTRVGDFGNSNKDCEKTPSSPPLLTFDSSAASEANLNTESSHSCDKFDEKFEEKRNKTKNSQFTCPVVAYWSHKTRFYSGTPLHRLTIENSRNQPDFSTERLLQPDLKKNLTHPLRNRLPNNLPNNSQNDKNSDRLPTSELNYICVSVIVGGERGSDSYSLRVYNRLPNDKKVFLTSEYLRRKYGNSNQVFRLPPGSYIDLGPIGNSGFKRDENNNSLSSVWISVGKGFGRGYARSEIIQCPLWMEIDMAPN